MRSSLASGGTLACKSGIELLPSREFFSMKLPIPPVFQRFFMKLNSLPERKKSAFSCFRRWRFQGHIDFALYDLLFSIPLKQIA